MGLLIETSTSWGRQIIQGAARFAHEQSNWMFFVEPRGRYEILRLPTDWPMHGVITRICDPELASEIAAARIPAVSVSWFDSSAADIVSCTVDEQQAGRLAAEHFLDRGFHHFAYVGPQNRPFYQDRFGEAYANSIQAAGWKCEVFPAGGIHHAAPLPQQELATWLGSLQKPLAMLAFDSSSARQVVETCQHQGIVVPEQVAVLAGEYDDVSCNICRPQLSYINLAADQIGYHAARLLYQMMQGEKSPRPMLIEPTNIVSQGSTDTLAVDDPELAAAIRLIRSRACGPLEVSDILAEVAMSRRYLEQRFKEVLGRSPGAEIRRVRLDEAKQLLRASELSVEQIAQSCGFSSGAVLSRTFRNQTGVTPSEYRTAFELARSRQADSGLSSST